MAISMMQPDSTVHLHILRDGATRDLSVQLAELPDNPEHADARQGKSSDALSGVAVEELDARSARQ